MQAVRRDFLKTAGAGLLGATTGFAGTGASAQTAQNAGGRGIFSIAAYGAVGDGVTVATDAINLAIEAAAAAGGGTVYFPTGNYLSYSIRLKSNVALYLDQGATIIAGSTAEQGASSGPRYDAAEPIGEHERFQDYGHNHWHNSLIWGEDLHDIAILGTGLIWGKGLSRGLSELPRAESPGVGNKAIALKNCRNVTLRDFSVLKGGHFAILATGVDNLTIDNLRIDTERDGMDLDCCRNVRVSNCSVNSPWDDAICPKSSFALGYARATENVTITNCYVTARYRLGSMLDGTWKEWAAGDKIPRTGRIKCGTESAGGFKNITVSNCVFDGCRGIALETVDGALLEDITFTGITMRDCTNTPIFLRLGSRMRAPKGTPMGTLKRVILSNIVSYNCAAQFACILSGIPGAMIEDVKLSDLYLHTMGGGTAEMAGLDPEEKAAAYPDPQMFGPLPASGFFLRHVRNLEMTNVELATAAPDARPAFWMRDVDGLDIFRLKLPKGAAAGAQFRMDNVSEFRLFGSRGIADIQRTHVEKESI